MPCTFSTSISTVESVSTMFGDHCQRQFYGLSSKSYDSSFSCYLSINHFSLQIINTELSRKIKIQGGTTTVNVQPCLEFSEGHISINNTLRTSISPVNICKPNKPGTSFAALCECTKKLTLGNLMLNLECLCLNLHRNLYLGVQSCAATPIPQRRRGECTGLWPKEIGCPCPLRWANNRDYFYSLIHYFFCRGRGGGLAKISLPNFFLPAWIAPPPPSPLPPPEKKINKK